MAIIVRSISKNKRFALMGSGFGAYQSKKPHFFFGDWVAETSEGQYAMVCVCDTEGRVGWLESSDVVVESIDGQRPEELL